MDFAAIESQMLSDTQNAKDAQERKTRNALALILGCNNSVAGLIGSLIDVFLIDDEKRRKFHKTAQEGFGINAVSIIEDIYYTALDAAVIELGFEEDVDDEFFRLDDAHPLKHLHFVVSGVYPQCGLHIIINSKPRRCKNYADILKYLKLWRKKHESLLRVSLYQV